MVSHRTRDSSRSTEAWGAYAPDLARWSWLFVNRIDVWGSYRPLHECGKEFIRADGTRGKLGTITTRPAKSRRGKVFLTEGILARHFEGRDVGHLVGLHTTSPENTSRWGAAEIDWHGPASTAPEANLAAALGWYKKLRSLGFRPLLTDSNGAGGYHLRFLFTEPVPTPWVYAFLRWLVSDHRKYGLPGPPEVFPKQPRIDAQNPYGNWLRLPGRHHTRDHWSQVWDGTRWLEGAEAIHHILTFAGDPPDLIPERITLIEARAKLPPPPYPLCRPSLDLGDYRLARRIQAYLARLPNLAEGQGRDNVAYRFACWLTRDLGLADDAALGWLNLWDARNHPPKGEDRLREILASAHQYGKREYGSGLAPCSFKKPFRLPRRNKHSREDSISFDISL